MELPICLTVQAWAARSVQFTSATDRQSKTERNGLRLSQLVIRLITATTKVTTMNFEPF
jgi:hypothetical protein